MMPSEPSTYTDRINIIFREKLHKISPITSAPTIIPLPLTIQVCHKNVILCVDFFFVQGTPYIHTITRDLQFRTIGEVINTSKKTMVDGF